MPDFLVILSFAGTIMKDILTLLRPRYLAIIRRSLTMKNSLA
jgi:hypothetical protein